MGSAVVIKRYLLRSLPKRSHENISFWLKSKRLVSPAFWIICFHRATMQHRNCPEHLWDLRETKCRVDISYVRNPLEALVLRRSTETGDITIQTVVWPVWIPPFSVSFLGRTGIVLKKIVGNESRSYVLIISNNQEPYWNQIIVNGCFCSTIYTVPL